MKSKQGERRILYYLNYLGDLVLYNVLWLLCCIPIITIGPATTALFSVHLDLVQESGVSGAKHFLQEFLRTFRKSIQFWFMIILAHVFLWADYVFLAYLMQPSPDILLPVCVALRIYLGFISVYLFPLLTRKNGTTKELLSLAIKMSVSYLPKTILLFIITIVPVFSFLFLPQTILLHTLPFWLLGGFSLLANLFARVLCKQLAQV